MKQLKSVQTENNKTDELLWHLCKITQDRMTALNLSARELGAKTNVSYTVIYDFIKRGIIPKVDTLMKLAEGLGLNVRIVPNKDSLNITISNNDRTVKKVSSTDELRKALYYMGIKNTKDIEDIEDFIEYKKFRQK